MGRLHTVSEILDVRAAGRGGMAVRPNEGLDPGGLFSVRQKLEKDRIIYDRRPRNDREVRMRRARLPAESEWPQVVIPPDSCLRGSVGDLSTYFYCLRQAPYGWAFNLLGL